MPTVYPSLAIPAPRRLALFKSEAAKPNWHRPMTWRDVRFAKLDSDSDLSQGLNGKTPVWYSFSEEFRDERDAHSINRLGHTGWYADPHQENLYIGIVARLPHGRFIAGYRISETGERVYFPDVFDDETDAAQSADEWARIYAEKEFDYQTLWQEARDIEQSIADRLDSLSELRDSHSATILAARVSANATVTVKRINQAARIRSDVSGLIELIRADRATLAESRFDSVRDA